ncbi:hypothetical protein ACQKQD_06790 [Methylobacterium sp. NPDC080182]|uniref:hypothetical protein n=1 Tax=Methylobacterium sp. NPDC080182 TaxID=3390590 RepID=UPI003D07A93B
MSESYRSSSRPRRYRQRLRHAADRLLPVEGLSDLVTCAVAMLLAGLLVLFVVGQIRDGALTGCPAYDGLAHKQEAEALCADR